MKKFILFIALASIIDISVNAISINVLRQKYDLSSKEARSVSGELDKVSNNVQEQLKIAAKYKELKDAGFTPTVALAKEAVDNNIAAKDLRKGIDLKKAINEVEARRINVTLPHGTSVDAADIEKEATRIANMLQGLTAGDYQNANNDNVGKITKFMGGYLKASPNERKIIRKKAGLMKFAGVIFGATSGAPNNYKFTHKSGVYTYYDVFIPVSKNSAKPITPPGSVEVTGKVKAANQKIKALLFHPDMKYVAGQNVKAPATKDWNKSASGALLNNAGQINAKNIFVALYHKGTKRIIAFKLVAEDASTLNAKKEALKKAKF